MTAGVLDRARARRILRSRHARRRELSQVTVLDSRSMAPTFVGECRATTDWRIPAGGPRPGQVVLAAWDDLLILHRVVANATDPDGRRRVLQMADNYEPGNPVGATWLAAEHVLAVVRSVEGEDGRLVYCDESRLCRAIDRVAAGLGRQLWRARHGVGTGRAGRITSALVPPARTCILTLGSAAVRLRLRSPAWRTRIPASSTPAANPEEEHHDRARPAIPSSRRARGGRGGRRRRGGPPRR